MTDLRALLQEARHILLCGDPSDDKLVARIDAALAESAPEPFLWWVNDKIWQHHPPSKEWLEDCQESGYLVRPLYAAPPSASPEWARKLEEQAANIIAWSCRLEAEQGAQARCLEWCRDKRRCTASFASPPASQDDGRAALAQRADWQLVPIKATVAMLTPYLTIEQWRLILAAAPKPEGKP